MRQRRLPLHRSVREQAWPNVPALLVAPEQMPALQVCVVVQRTPHAPQLAASVLRLTQAVPHIVCGAEQVTVLRQTPDMQLCVVVQRTPHAPQLAASVLRLTQAVPHIVCGAEQALWQRPAAHVSPSPHGWLQPPQCAGLMLVSTQPPPHASRDAEHPTEPTSAPTSPTSLVVPTSADLTGYGRLPDPQPATTANHAQCTAVFFIGLASRITST